MKPAWHILPIIVIAQFCCTSLWFASNGVIEDLMDSFQLQTNSIGYITSAIQFGFISGTLVFASLTISDRFSPSAVFFICAVLGAFFNLGISWEGNELWSLLTFRFLTGFFLAGIYPVGMKIAADYFENGLGRSLGFLVGALVIGTSFPHLAKAFATKLSWNTIIITTSSLALFGGFILWLFVPDGPFRQKSSSLKLSAFVKVFSKRDFREAAFGYFGHMWELYAFWTFIPVALTIYNTSNKDVHLNVPLWSFYIISIGAIGCVLAGFISQRFGEKSMASGALFLSGLCCLISPLIFNVHPYLFLGFLLFWGIMVIADSPLFSTLVAKRAPAPIKGTALTIVNCIGFAITIVSIQLLTLLLEQLPSHYLFLILAIGPLFGLVSLRLKKEVSY